MKIIAIAKFKTQCLAILEGVRRTSQPVPVREPARPKSWLGRYRTEGRIMGDIVAPAAKEMEWEALSKEALSKQGAR